MRFTRVGRVSVVAMAITAVAVPIAMAGERGPTARAAACSSAKNVEAIIDDSGSMAITDPDLLRIAGLDLLIQTPGYESLTLGAVEFGGSFFSGTPSADTVFAPERIGAARAAMQAALAAKVNADNGTTDYNAAFAKANADNPSAQARIFLTDGAHNAGTYGEGHRGGPPTYVIGFGRLLSGGTDLARLKRIAAETKGTFYRVVSGGDLQPVFNDIGLKLACLGVARRFGDTFRRAGASAIHSVALGSAARSAQLTLTWASPRDVFTLTGIRVVRRGRVVAASRVRRLKVTRRRGKTFTVVKVSNVTAGRLQFRVRATRIGSGAPKVRLVTQVSQSRRR